MESVNLCLKEAPRVLFAISKWTDVSFLHPLVSVRELICEEDLSVLSSRLITTLEMTFYGKDCWERCGMLENERTLKQRERVLRGAD